MGVFRKGPKGKALMTLEQAKPLTPGWELPICLEKQKCLVSRFLLVSILLNCLRCVSLVNTHLTPSANQQCEGSKPILNI